MANECNDYSLNSPSVQSSSENEETPHYINIDGVKPLAKSGSRKNPGKHFQYLRLKTQFEKIKLANKIKR